MEKIPVEERTKFLYRQKLPNSSIPSRTKDLPFIHKKNNSRIKSKVSFKKSKKNKEDLIYYGISCIVAGGVLGLFSSLLGHTLLEQTRRDQIRTKEKIIRLKYEISHLKGKIEEAKYHETIDHWAEAKGMINERLNQTKTEEDTIPSQVLKDAYVSSF